MIIENQRASYLAHQREVTSPPNNDQQSLSIINKINNMKNTSRALIIGYSPTGGGHTGRLLNVVEHALHHGSLSAGHLVFFHVPAHWENIPRSNMLNRVANKLIAHNVTVKFAECGKPIYGYINKSSGSSNDVETLRRIALHPLRNKKTSPLNHFIEKYFHSKNEVKYNEITPYRLGDDLNDLPKITHENLISGVINTDKISKENVFILTDMDPGLQKSAFNHKIPNDNRIDQQNHSIMLKKDNKKTTRYYANALLAKILDARGGKISHISLGKKNTLIETYHTATLLKMKINTTLLERRIIINNILFSVAKTPPEDTFDAMRGGVLKGHNVKTPADIKKVIYIYAHNKNNIILEHIINQLINPKSHYHDFVFIFCGRDAIPGYNALHLAYLIDADGITTAGAGTCGEFAYLHQEGKAQSHLLILPIENHNEQEVTANLLSNEFPEYVLRLKRGETLKDSKRLSQLITRMPGKKGPPTAMQDSLMAAISRPESYAKQTHDILFGHSAMSDQMLTFRRMQRHIYNSPEMKATRHYLKLYFQLVTHFTLEITHFPIRIYFKEKQFPDIVFYNIEDIKNIFINKAAMMKLLNLSSPQQVNQLPLFSEVKNLMVTKKYPPAAADILALNQRLGHYMTTGF